MATNPLYSTIPAGQTGRQETLSEWAGPYVTGMLGKAQALAESPYQIYGGPLTAGVSPLQRQAFRGISGLGVPSDLTGAAQTAEDVATAAGGMGYTPGSFTSAFNAPSAYQPMGGSYTDAGVAQQYMNPYMQTVLAPQMQAMQRQADIQRAQAGAQAARAGAFGGARAGLMGQQIAAELMRQQQQATGQAYGQAYTQGLGQFNVEQARRAQEAQFGAQQAMTAAQLGAQYGQSAQQAAEQSRQFGAQYGLQGLAQRLAAAQARGQMGVQQSDIQRANLAQLLGAGAQQRAIAQEGIAADIAEFERQRDYPYKMLQFQQSMLQGMPIQSIAAQYQQPTGLANTINTMGGLIGLYEKLYPKG